MTKKDYEIIARGLAVARPRYTPGGKAVSEDAIVAWSAACVTISKELSLDNPRFDSVRFLKATQA